MRNLEERQIVVDGANAAHPRDGAEDAGVIGCRDRAAKLDFAAGDGDFDLGAEAAEAMAHAFGDDGVRRPAAAEDEPRKSRPQYQPYREEDDLARFHFKVLRSKR